MSSPESSIVPQAIVRSKAPKAGGSRVRYRACLLCSFIQTSPEWKANGCPNCDDILDLKGDEEKIKECTSIKYDGVIALLKPEESWVAKWQRLGNFTKGLYAVRVIGRLPQNAIEDLQEKGFQYIPRDNVGGV